MKKQLLATLCVGFLSATSTLAADGASHANSAAAPKEGAAVDNRTPEQKLKSRMDSALALSKSGGVVPISADPVTDLENFLKLDANKGKTIFVEFWSPMCGHCKTYKKTYEQLAQSNRWGSWTAVDISENAGPILKKFKFSGTPTVQVYRDGKLISPDVYGKSSDEIRKQFAK
jgi:thiol-disulfide isomerase/thioredoxin